jgi:2-C-methyl-D-erythritol 4-phosphate cytidylyltransferase
VPGLPLTEVVKEVIPTGAGMVAGASLPRETHRLIQTPHAFRAEVLRAAHAQAPEAVEDSAMVAERGAAVAVVPGEPTNIHVTTPEELAMARLLLPQVLGLLGAGAGPTFEG